MSAKRQILITADSTIAAGRFVDRGDVIEVTAQVAQDLFNERKATGDEIAIAARLKELASAPVPDAEQAAPDAEPPKAEKASAKAKAEKASAK